MNIKQYDRFSDLPPATAAMLRYPIQPNFFRSLDWFESLFRTTLYANYEPRIYVADRSALFCMTKPGSSVLLSMTNFYTVDYGLTSSADADTVVSELREILSHIAEERPRWTVVKTMFMDASDMLSDAFGKSMHAGSFHVQPFTQYENWYVRPGKESFKQYYASRPAKLRNTIERKSKALIKNQKVDIRIYDKSDASLSQAILDYYTVAERSWKGREPFPAFIPDLVRTCAALGILRLGMLYLDGRPVATQLWINTTREAMIYKLSYDEEFKATSVGSILSHAMFERAIDVDNVEEIDYGVGSEPYKKDWMSHVRIVQGLNSLNVATFRGATLAVTELAKGVVKSVTRQAKNARRPGAHKSMLV